MLQARIPGTTSACTRRLAVLHLVIIHSPLHPLPIPLCYAATVVTRTHTHTHTHTYTHTHTHAHPPYLLHGNASRQYGTRQRKGARGFPAHTASGLLPTTAVSIPHVGCRCLLLPGTGPIAVTPAPAATTAPVPPAATTTATNNTTAPSVATFAPGRGEEAFTAVNLKPA